MCFARDSVESRWFHSPRPHFSFPRRHFTGSKSRSSELVGSAMTPSSGPPGITPSSGAPGMTPSSGPTGDAPISPNLFVTLPSPESASPTVLDLAVGMGGVGAGGVGGYQSTPLYLNSPSTHTNNQVLDSSTGSMGTYRNLH